MASIMEAFDPSIVSAGGVTAPAAPTPLFARARGQVEDKVFHSLEDMMPKRVPRPISFHPLQNSWTMWLFTNDPTKPWEENQHPIHTFTSVEDFWGLYHNIAPPSELPGGCDYSLFKAGIKPMWEDEKNKDGGRWLLQSQARKNVTGSPGKEQPVLDLYWLEVLMCLIGEGWGNPSYAGDINGAVFSKRKNSKLGVWLADCENTEAVLNIGLNIKARLGLGPRANIQFEAHQDTKSRRGSMVKHMYKI